MTNVAKTKHIRKRKAITTERDTGLKGFCDAEQLKIIRGCVRRGDVIILLQNGEFTPIEDFYKALFKEMKLPTYNGACIYDARVQVRKAYNRDTVTITLNDYSNSNIVESIKRLGPLRSSTLYTKHYECEV